MTTYVFGGTDLVARQLSGIAQAFDAVSTSRLQEIGIHPGRRCLEIGAGNGSIARRMADLVGPAGSVDATDLDIAHLVGQARPNLTVRRHDITVDPLPDAAYDLIHARLVLMHLPDRERVVARLAAALRPGGWLLTEDYDVQPPPKALAAPDPAAAALYDRTTLALSQVTAAAGVDNGWGAHAYAAFRRAGLEDVTAEGYVRSTPVHTPGYDLLATYVRQLREPMLKTETVTAADLDRFLGLVEDPRFVLSTPQLVSTWGRRPVR